MRASSKSLRICICSCYCYWLAFTAFDVCFRVRDMCIPEPGETDPWYTKQLEIFIQEVNEFLRQKEWKDAFVEFIHNHTAFFGGNVTVFAEGHYDVWENFKIFSIVYC